MTIADNMKASAITNFLRECTELESDPRFEGREGLIPHAAATSLIVEASERLAQRTEIECKKEIYMALGKDAP